MLQVLPHQKLLMETAVLGKHHLTDDTTWLTFRQFVKLCKHPLPDGTSRIFHARRNDEMIQALVAKKLFGAKIKIVFTSTAQRHHSNSCKLILKKSCRYHHPTWNRYRDLYTRRSKKIRWDQHRSLWSYPPFQRNRSPHRCGHPCAKKSSPHYATYLRRNHAEVSVLP
jgi:hypothetical protein